jgi:peptidoglycan/LPS O-acetylase OafA/YrhL
MTALGVPPRSPRYQSLDLWRGVACVFVVLYHSVLVYVSGPRANEDQATTAILGVLGHLNVGVFLFFVISGYCIAAASDSARRHRSAIRLYFWRRFRRIYPPLWIVIALAVLFFAVVDVTVSPGLLSEEPWSQLRPWWYSQWQWLGNVTLTETWRYHVGGGPRGHFPGQAWTLCYEEQFYAVTGALLLVPQRLFAGALAVTVITVAVMLGASAMHVDIAGFFFDGSWLTFASGILVYHAINYGSERVRPFSYAVLGVAAIAAVPLGVPGGALAFLFSGVLLALHRHDRAITQSRVAMPLIWCGQMCYSLYLVHQLVVKAVSQWLYESGIQTGLGTLAVTVPVSLMASLIVGRAFYQVVERRFLNAPVGIRGAIPATDAPLPELTTAAV